MKKALLFLAAAIAACSSSGERFAPLSGQSTVTSIVAGTGVTTSGASGAVTISVNATAVQTRMQSCAANQAIRVPNQDGTVTCIAPIITVSGGSGVNVSGGAPTSTISLDNTVWQARVTGTAGAHTAVTGVNANGTVTTAGVVDSVGASGDLTLSSGAVDVDETKVQHRVTGTAAAGSAITSVNQNGTVGTAVFVNAAGNGLSLAGSTLSAVAQSGKLIAVGVSGIALDTTGATSTSRIVYDGTNPKWVSNLQQQSSRENCWWDELDVPSGTTSNHFQEANIGSPTFSVTAGSDLHPSVWTCSSSASSTGGCSIRTNSNGMALSATDITTITFIFDTRTLDDGVDTYGLEVGAGDTNTLTQTDGFGFLYAKTTAIMGSATTPKWQIWVSNNSQRTFATLDGITADTVDSTVAVGDMSQLTGQIYKATVSCTTARCDFCLGDTDDDGYCHAGSTGHVGSACASGCSMVATNIPAAGTARTWGAQILIGKQAGTSVARILDVDGGGVCRPFSVAR